MFISRLNRDRQGRGFVPAMMNVWHRLNYRLISDITVFASGKLGNLVVQPAVISCRKMRFEEFVLPSLTFRSPYL
jgi:hypothetical protein